MYYVYILKSLKDNKLYIGYTTDLKKRFEKHQKGEVTATEYRRPLELIFYEAYKSKSDAKRRTCPKTPYSAETAKFRRPACLPAGRPAGGAATPSPTPGVKDAPTPGVGRGRCLARNSAISRRKRVFRQVLEKSISKQTRVTYDVK